MSRVKVTAMSLFAVIALSVVAVSSASAEWLVGGKALGTTTAALTTSALVDEKTKLLVPAIEDLTIECKGETLDGENPRIEGADKGFASKLTFLECSTVKPGECRLEPETKPIATNPILALAALKSGEEDKVTFTPETKAVFAEIAFSETNKCAFNGVEGVKGSVVVGAPTGTLELETQPIVGLGSVENNSLEVGGSKAFLIGGKALLKLASGSKWSFM
jgi:hypothetical protein